MTTNETLKTIDQWINPEVPSNQPPVRFRLCMIIPDGNTAVYNKWSANHDLEDGLCVTEKSLHEYYIRDSIQNNPLKIPFSSHFMGKNRRKKKTKKCLLLRMKH